MKSQGTAGAKDLRQDHARNSYMARGVGEKVEGEMPRERLGG